MYWLLNFDFKLSLLCKVLFLKASIIIMGLSSSEVTTSTPGSCIPGSIYGVDCVDSYKLKKKKDATSPSDLVAVDWMFRFLGQELKMWKTDVHIAHKKLP